MRTLWNIVSFLAIVHLLALIGFIGWLWSSDRLSVDRVHAVRDMLSVTVGDEAAAAAESERLVRQQQAEALSEAMLKNPPVTSAAQIELISRIQEQSDQAQRRMREEHGRLRARLDAVQQELQARQADFEAQKAAWIAAEKAEQERKLNEQFAQVVKLLESIPAKLAKEKIRELVDSDNTHQAVAYLDAMNSRAAAAVIREFKTAEENRLATELLEKLRTFNVPGAPGGGGAPAPAGMGGQAGVAEDSPNGPSDSDTT